jgi:hypothetical protein
LRSNMKILRVSSLPVVDNSPGIKMEKAAEKEEGNKNISDVYLNSLCAFKNLFYLFSVRFPKDFHIEHKEENRVAKGENGSRNGIFMLLLFLFHCFSCAARGFSTSCMCKLQLSCH